MASCSKRLEGKVAIVTGSSSGIGFAIAQGLAENGAKVLMCSRSQDNIDKAVSSLKELHLDVTGTVCDVSNRQHVKDLVQKCVDTYGQLDIVVPNAAISTYFGPLLEITDELWDKYMDTNLKTGFWIARDALPHLQKTKGTIIYVSSTMAYNPLPNVGMYSITKTGQLALIKLLAYELAGKGIRVNAISPGCTDTDLASKSYDAFSKLAGEAGMQVSKEALIQSTNDKVIPMKRFAQPSEMAGAVVFLASQDSSYITGEVINIGGGLSTRL